MKYEIISGFPRKQKISNINPTFYENGAHFKYINLYSKLLLLYSTLPLERLGNQGVYFQEEKESNPYSKSKLILPKHYTYTPNTNSRNITESSSILYKHKRKINLNIGNISSNTTSIWSIKTVKRIIKLKKNFIPNLVFSHIHIQKNTVNKNNDIDQNEIIKKQKLPMIIKKNKEPSLFYIEKKPLSIENKVTQYQQFKKLYTKNSTKVTNMKKLIWGLPNITN
jgi:hypothetical protein